MNDPSSVSSSLTLLSRRHESGFTSAFVELLTSGDLALHCADSGYAVAMTIGENVTMWHRWYTVAAANVPVLAEDPDNPERVLMVVAEAMQVSESDSAEHLESRFADWLRAQGVSYTFREFDEYD